MSVVINTNVDSLKIQKSLTNSTNQLSKSMQRMSTGLKVSSAKDDAAGSVISARMKVQLNGNQIAQKNVQSGNAMLSTAEGNIDVVLDNVSRIRDLTLQAKNGTYSAEEIAAMQKEVAERIAEIDRVSTSSKYSQLKLFDDTNMQQNGVTFQVGANSTSDNTIKADGSIFESVKFNEVTGRDGSTKKEAVLDTGNVPAAGGGKHYIAVTAEEAIDDDGSLKADYKVAFKADDTEAANPIYLHEVADTTGTAYADATNLKLGKMDDVQGPTGLDLTTLDAKGFSTALVDLDQAIDNLTARKSLIGSAQNRLDSALNTLTTQYENLSSANSIITDADIASEASEFTQSQILQQVSTSLLAQANQAPSIALSLV